ncbi:hypothetical protein FI667_g16818, partial [Globisporangium splendens]
MAASDISCGTSITPTVHPAMRCIERDSTIPIGSLRTLPVVCVDSQHDRRCITLRCSTRGRHFLFDLRIFLAVQKRNEDSNLRQPQGSRPGGQWHGCEIVSIALAARRREFVHFVVLYSVVGLFRVLFVFLMCYHFGGSVFYALAHYEKSPVGWLRTDPVRVFQIEKLWVLLEHHFFYEQNDLLPRPTDVVRVWLTTPGMLVADPLTNQSRLATIPLLTKYLRGYHYAIGSISTVTYGDICARSVAETSVQIVIAFLCVVFYGGSSSSSKWCVCSTLDATMRSRIRLLRACACISKIDGSAKATPTRSALQHLSPQLQSEIRDFLQRKVWFPVPGARVIGQSGVETCGGGVKKALLELPCFLVSVIVAKLTEQHFFTDDVIYEPGTCMNLVESGKVLLAKHDDRKNHQQQQQQQESDRALH